MKWTSILHPLATFLIAIVPFVPNGIAQTILGTLGAILGGSTFISRAADK